MPFIYIFINVNIYSVNSQFRINLMGFFILIFTKKAYLRCSTQASSKKRIRRNRSRSNFNRFNSGENLTRIFSSLFWQKQTTGHFKNVQKYLMIRLNRSNDLSKTRFSSFFFPSLYSTFLKFIILNWQKEILLFFFVTIIILDVYSYN